jgi:hypothetical protein
MNLRMIWAGVSGCVLALGMFGSVVAGPFEDGEAAFQSGDYATALKDWLPLANQGNAAAQNNIAAMYHAGQGVPQSDAIATQWLEKAAANGNADAEFSLGLSYASGDVVPQSDAQAAAWYLKAANQGDAAAQSMLGLAYYKGQGVTQDYVSAYMWVALGVASFAKTNPKLSQDGTQTLTQIESGMTAPQITQAQALVARWKPK